MRTPSPKAAEIARAMLNVWEGQSTVNIADAWVSVSAMLVVRMGAIHGQHKALETAIADLRGAVALKLAKPTGKPS